MNTNSNTKRILLYGDSFVYGKASGDNKRLDSKTRFSGVLQDLLGPRYDVIEEGLRGRTLDGENAFFESRNGLTQFGPIIGSHLPIDLVIIMLGTNDCNSKSSKGASEIADSFAKYTKLMSEWSLFLNVPRPRLLIVAPPTIDESHYDDGAQAVFGKGAASRLLELPAASHQLQSLHVTNRHTLAF